MNDALPKNKNVSLWMMDVLQIKKTRICCDPRGNNSEERNQLTTAK